MNDNRPMQKGMTGRLFVVEGLDGSGKATQVSLLIKRLREEGNMVTLFNFPDYDRLIGTFIRDSLHGKYGNLKNVGAFYRSFPYAIDRMLAREKIRAALKKGVVVCDRYTTSNLAFGTASCAPKDRAKFRKFFEELEYGLFKLPRPDRVIYLSVPTSVTRQWLLKERRGKLDINERDAKFQRVVDAQYKLLAKGKEWRTVSYRAGDTPEDIGKKVRGALA
jgi:dTMP kinase